MSTFPGTQRNATQELIYPTSVNVRGPWLLETNHLLALDAILEKFCYRNDPEWRNRPSQAETPAAYHHVQPLGQPHDFRSRKSLTIYLSKDRELNTPGFKEAMSNIAFQDDVAKGFEYVIETRSVTASVRLPKKSEKKDDVEQWFLTIGVTPKWPSPETGNELFVELRKWTDSVRSTLLYQWILFEPRTLYRIALGILLLIILANAYNPSPSAAEYKATLKQEARDLLRGGINPQNQGKALELVLALESDYLPPRAKPQSRKPSGWYLIWIYVLAFLSFPPTVCIGIWAGAKRLNWWKPWLRFNTVTIPSTLLGLLLTHYFDPQLFSMLDSALHR